MQKNNNNFKNVGDNNNNYDMDCVFGRNNARSDWLILGHCSLVMPMGRMWACRNKKPDHKQAQSLRENLKPRNCRIDRAIGLRFSAKIGPLRK